ncbi:histone H1-like [Mizuhopecten yessoensis]|nr:histone H1-like [Mizuhopecten yessoensis]
MSDAAVKAPAKVAKKASKPKGPPAHPTYNAMIKSAIAANKDKKGSSKAAIVKYIMASYKVGNDAKPVNSRVKVALKNGLAKKDFVQSKGTGASGSFKLGEKPKTAKVAKKAQKPAAKKVKKPKKAATTPKKAAAKKPKAAKKSKSPKKASKSPKKAKAVAKPKAKKPAAKKAVKKAAPKKK